MGAVTGPVCDRDGFHSPYDDCILERIEARDYALTAEIEAALDERTAKKKAIAARQREYRAANREAIAAKQRKIYDARMDRGYSQAVLGQLCGVSQRAISFWERGEVPADWGKLIPVLPELAEVAYG